MRLLVIDHSRILPWVLGHEFPDGLELETAASFEEAARRVTDDPPDAVVVSVPPATLPWRDFQHLCASRTPAVPVLYETCLSSADGELALDPADGYAAFLRKPAPRCDLHAAVEALLVEARRLRAAVPALSAPDRS